MSTLFSITITIRVSSAHNPRFYCVFTPTQSALSHCVQYTTQSPHADTHTHTYTLLLVANSCLCSDDGLCCCTNCGSCLPHVEIHHLHHLAQMRAVLLLEGIPFLLSFGIVYELFSSSLLARHMSSIYINIYVYICMY